MADHVTVLHLRGMTFVHHCQVMAGSVLRTTQERVQTARMPVLTLSGISFSMTTDMSDIIIRQFRPASELGVPTLGVAMIVKNAEDTIEAALQSVAGAVDQVVVVDTGSTDSTPFLVARSGAELYFKRWENSFAAARNHALSFLRTDWCLILDADEVLDTENFFEVRQRMNTHGLGGLQVSIHNSLSAQNETSSTHSYTRLFKRHPKIRFEGAIHEQVADSIRALGLCIEQSECEIYHEGYKNVGPHKTERNADLLRQELRDKPDDVWATYHLGLTDFSAGHLKEAAALLNPLRTSPMLTVEQQETATIRCAQCALAEDDFMRVEELLAQPFGDNEREGLRQYILGAAYCNKLNFAAGLRCFQMARDTQTRLVDQQVLETTISQIESLRRR